MDDTPGTDAHNPGGKHMIAIADERSIAVPSAAFEMGFHCCTQSEMARKQRALIEARPKVRFAGLKPEGVYAYKTHDGYAIYCVHRITPTGKQADLSRFGEGNPIRRYAGDLGGEFILLDELLISFLGVTHEMIVGEANKLGLHVPTVVRREHPHLFIDIPNRFAGKGKHESSTPAARVKDALRPVFMVPVDADKIESILQRASDSFGEFLACAMKNKALNPSTDNWYDRAEQDFHDAIDFYSWLKPLVSPGGVFHID